MGTVRHVTRLRDREHSRFVQPGAKPTWLYRRFVVILNINVNGNVNVNVNVNVDVVKREPCRLRLSGNLFEERPLLNSEHWQLVSQFCPWVRGLDAVRRKCCFDSQPPITH